MTADQFVNAIALTESNGDQHAWGDGGRAMGRFQVHPDWVYTWSRITGVQPHLSETWDSFITRLVAGFFNHASQQRTAVETAMYFHLGHPSYAGADDWDVAYAERFSRFAGMSAS